MACAPSEDPDQPGHPPKLIIVVTIRIKKPRVLSYARRRLWSDWADAQADLSLLWAHSHFVGFVMRRLRSSFFHACVPLAKLRHLDINFALLKQKTHLWFCFERPRFVNWGKRISFLCKKIFEIETQNFASMQMGRTNVYLSIILKKMCLISFIVRSQERGCRSHCAASWKKKKKKKKWHVRPAKTQSSLGVRPVWSEPSLPAWKKPLATHWAHSENSDQTGRTPRLLWVFAGRTLTLYVLSWGGSYLISKVTGKYLTLLADCRCDR